MENRNARFVSETAIEMEIDHPTFGWVPFTATPEDVEPQGRALFEAAKDIAAPYIAPPPEPVVLPPLTRRQLLLGLLAIGITGADVEAQIGLIEDPQERAAAMIEWQSAGLYNRDHPLVADLALAFDLPEGQVDDLWRWAAGL